MTTNDFNNWLQSLSSEEHDYALAYEHYWMHCGRMPPLYKLSETQAHNIRISIQDYCDKQRECFKHILRNPFCEACMADEEKDQNND